MLHGTIHDNDFQHNTALQCWNNVVTTQNNVATLSCTKNCHCKSSRVTSPWGPLLRSRIQISSRALNVILEIPTFRDLKSGDSLFFTMYYTPPASNGNSPKTPHTPPPNKLTPPTNWPSRCGLRHYSKSYMKYMQSKFAFIIVMTK